MVQPVRSRGGADQSGQKDGHFGYKAHITVDKGSGPIRRLALTGANVAESLVFEEMVPGDKASVFADAAYTKKIRKTAWSSQGVICGIISDDFLGKRAFKDELVMADCFQRTSLLRS